MESRRQCDLAPAAEPALAIRSLPAVSDPVPSAEVIKPPLQLVRLPVDKPQPAVAFLRARSGGVMDLIAHFWERLAHTPPLQRQDLHLVVATPVASDNVNINIPQLDSAAFSGAMLYVPKAHRADVLALDPSTAAAFASYISHLGLRILRGENPAATPNAETSPIGPKNEPSTTTAAGEAANSTGNGHLSLTDLSLPVRNGTIETSMPAEPHAGKTAGRMPIDFLTGEAEGISWMVPLLLPLVHKKAPARQLVNVVMHLPPEVAAAPDPHVRLARESDIPVLNRWRRQYKEERGILFDADMDAWVQNQRVFVYEIPAEAGTSGNGGGAGVAMLTGTIAAAAKIDLDLASLVEIGGVYTFPEHRNHGYGAGIVRDMAARIRQAGKTPTLQVDEQNTPALKLYEKAGWRILGRLARIWLIAS
jgi:GNAT superfamily N-acetyltransferase